MNLMFWKKKTAPEDGVDNQQENSEGDAAPENSSDDELAGDPERPGLIARLKSKLTALFSRFKKSDTAKDDVAGEQSEESADKQHDDPSNESATATEKAPEKPGLIARIKSQFSGLLGRFRKPAQKASDAKEHGQPAEKPAETPGKESPQPAGKSAEETQAEPKKPGLIERLKPMLAPLGAKLRASGSGLFSFLSEYMVYLLSALALILLVGVIYVARDIIFPPLVRKTTSSDPAKYVKPVPASAPEAAPTLEPESKALPDPNASPQAAAEIFQKRSEEAKAKAEALIKEAEELQKKSEEAKAQAEALKKKEEEERAQAEALRKKQEEERANGRKNQAGQQNTGSSGQQTTGGTKVMPGSNEWTAGNKDPKATAKTLKEAIDAMNAESSGNISRPAKPPANP